jgi:hypothetical protein
LTNVTGRTSNHHVNLTLRSAPALELNLVAVTTRLFLGSTAPTATSGVSTTAISLGGAVRIAAQPKRTAKGDNMLDEALMGVVGVRGPLTLKRPFPIKLTLEVDRVREFLRCDPRLDETERECVERLRGRVGVWFILAEGGIGKAVSIILDFGSP